MRFACHCNAHQDWTVSGSSAIDARSYEAVPRSHCAQRQLEASNCHAYDQNAEYEVQFCLLCRDRHILRHIFRLGITQHISARPNRFDMIFAAGGFA